MPINQSTLTGYADANPIGVIDLFTGSSIPDGWLTCDGSAISRSAYSGLFSLIGTKFGSGNGSTTFNIPDLKGRVAVGYAASGHADVSTIGNNEGTILANRRPAHNHTNSLTAAPSAMTLPNHTHTASTNHSHGNANTGTADNGHSGLTGTGRWRGTGTGGSTSSSTAGASIGNVSSGSFSLGGSISSSGYVGPTGTNPNDLHPYLVIQYIIKY